MAQQWWGPAVKSKSDVDEEHEDTSQNLASPNRDEQEAAGCTMPKRLKSIGRFGELSNTQRHPPLELPDDEHEKDTEMQGDQGGGTFENEQEPRDAPKATRNN